jgi:hypothetical protein
MESTTCGVDLFYLPQIDTEINSSPSPSRDCVVIMMEGGFRENRQSGSSALECGRLKLWVIGLLGNGIHFMDLKPKI